MSLFNRRDLLRAVLIAYAFGHLIVALQFLFWPGWFLLGEGSRPLWPLSGFQFGVWPPLHTGFMNVISMYDLATASALVWASRAPEKNKGILFFAIVLWLGHGGMHLGHVIWGTSPAIYVWTTVELWVGVVLLAVLWPREPRASAAA